MEERFLRLKQIVGDKKQGIEPLIPIAKSTWWLMVKNGAAPQPVKLGPSTTCWRLSDVQDFISKAGV